MNPNSKSELKQLRVLLRIAELKMEQDAKTIEQLQARLDKLNARDPHTTRYSGLRPRKEHNK